MRFGLGFIGIDVNDFVLRVLGQGFRIYSLGLMPIDERIHPKWKNPVKHQRETQLDTGVRKCGVLGKNTLMEKHAVSRIRDPNSPKTPKTTIPNCVRQPYKP